MITQEKKRILRSILAVAVSAVTIASVTIPAYCAPSAKELEITTSGLRNDLNDLNSQLSSLSADLDATSAQIEGLSAEVEKAKLDLAAAQLTGSSSCTREGISLCSRFYSRRRTWLISLTKLNMLQP